MNYCYIEIEEKDLDKVKNMLNTERIEIKSIHDTALEAFCSKEAPFRINMMLEDDYPKELIEAVIEEVADELADEFFDKEILDYDYIDDLTYACVDDSHAMKEYLKQQEEK